MHVDTNQVILIFSFLVYTALIILLLYAVIVCKRKSDLRQGWAKRFDKAMLKLTRMFLGTSRLMVVHYESHDEMCMVLIDQIKKEEKKRQLEMQKEFVIEQYGIMPNISSIDQRDFLSENYSKRF